MTSKEVEFPPISQSLLDALASLYPDTLPTSATTPYNEVIFAAGSAHVVRFLRSKFNEQNETVLLQAS